MYMLNVATVFLKKINAHPRKKYLLIIYNENSVLVTDFSATALDQTPVSSLDHGSVAMSSEGMMQIIPPPAVSVNKSPHGGMPLDNLKSWCQILLNFVNCIITIYLSHSLV